MLASLSLGVCSCHTLDWTSPPCCTRNSSVRFSRLKVSLAKPITLSLPVPKHNVYTSIIVLSPLWVTILLKE
uniref:Macaca fascicularis brain cDNA clone: QflA-23279, similar to human FLJ44955 protein (FLJ44955), mRNA, RefSeq: NM_207500.1 n=1 Tax=Macaca fascicularis TaxID=9541 RepID=I7GMQ8_MACFA|nr:unnamed protein product [Macaca fascicularis]